MLRYGQKCVSLTLFDLQSNLQFISQTWQKLQIAALNKDKDSALHNCINLNQTVRPNRLTLNVIMHTYS